MLQTFKPAIRDCNTDFFQWILCNIVQFLRTPILKNNWVQLLLIMAIWLLYVFQGNSTIILSMVSLLFWVKARTVYLIEQFRSSQGVMSVIWLSLLTSMLYLWLPQFCADMLQFLTPIYVKRAVWGALLWIVTCMCMHSVYCWPHYKYHTRYNWMTYPECPTHLFRRGTLINLMIIYTFKF